MNDTETFQHYQVLKREDGSLWELGRGAMGVTYKAFDVNLRCHVALKVINAQYLDSEMARARFLREARAAAGLRHRNVASVYHLGNDTESFFYSMEFIDGQTVENLVTSRGPLPAADALQIARQVARALGAAAKQGVVHRDIKPANLMVVYEDEGDDEGFVVKVIDFGLARSAVAATGGENSGAITMGGFVGTPQYASPEQIEENNLDVRSDIYSLGITLWYMLVGQPPFTGTVFRISSQHLTKEPPWEDIKETVPEAVRALLARMLQKDPAARPQTPAKLRTEIEECLRQLPLNQASQLVLGAPAVVADDTRIPEEIDAQATVVEGPAPTEGRLFAGRYQLGSLVGEGASGQIFRAYDGRLDGKLVAVKVLHPDLNLSAQAFYHLQGDLARLRDAPHPHLIETFVLEKSQGYRFSVMEWINGYPLQGLLRSKGALTLREALRLLGQAADAAAHCSTQRLHRLELSPHKILLHFPTLDEHSEAPSPASLVARNLDDSPHFSLKIDALAPAREAAKGSTLRSRGASPRMNERDTLTSIRGLVEGSYFYALATLLYELLGATPPPVGHAQEAVPLETLGDDGNTLLKRAFSTNPGFATENEFFQALLRACNLSADDIGLARPGSDSATKPAAARSSSVRLSSAEAMTYVPMQARSAEAPPEESPAPATSPVVPAKPAAVPKPDLDEGGKTIAYDQAATLVQPQRISPFPPPVETRARPVPMVKPPTVVAPPPPVTQPPPDKPSVAPLDSDASQGANLAEAVTYAPVEPARAARSKAPPEAKAPPPAPAAPPTPAPRVVAPPSDAPPPAPAPAAAPVPALPPVEPLFVPAAAVPARPAKPFPLVPVLAGMATLLIGGTVAAVILSRAHPARPANTTAASTPVSTLTAPRADVPSIPPPPVIPTPAATPLAVNVPTPAPSLPPVLPTATPLAEMPVMEEVVPTPAPTPVPTVSERVQPPARPNTPAPTPPKAATPAPTPRRDNKANPGLPAPKPPRPAPTPEKAVQKAKPTPAAKSPKATPRNDDDTPNFLR